MSFRKIYFLLIIRVGLFYIVTLSLLRMRYYIIAS